MSIGVSSSFAGFAGPSIVDSLYHEFKVDDLATENRTASWDLPVEIPDGSFTFCFMPHPNIANYQPMENGALIHLEYFQRHQVRSPYEMLGGDGYDCDGVNRLGGSRLNNWNEEPNSIIIETPENEFTNITGSCQYPQLTVLGVENAMEHGSDLRALYGNALHLIPEVPTPDTVKYRVSNSHLTESTANGVSQGLFGSYTSNLLLYQQPMGYDTLNGNFHCDRREVIKAQQRTTDTWKKHLEVINNSLETINSTSYLKGFAVRESWMADMDHLADNIQAKLCHSLKFDIAPKVYNPVLNAAEWEWDYWYRSGPNATEYTISMVGPLIAEALTRLKNPGSLRYHHSFGHDNDIGPLATSLGIDYLRWPGMAANIAIELWKVNNQKKIRVLYCGSPIKSTSGLDLGAGVDLEDFIKFWEKSSLTQAKWCNEGF